MKKKEKIECPYCGYKMPLQKDENAACRGLYVKCKARGCGRIFEIKINGSKIR